MQAPGRVFTTCSVASRVAGGDRTGSAMTCRVDCHRPRHRSLGLLELVAIALGGMVGGGIFTILGISVSLVGVFTPLIIVIGGLIAALAAYSYIGLGVHYRAEGGAYAFFRLVFPESTLAASLIGWWVVFGYISTLALYAYTFSSYAISGTAFADTEWVRKAVAGGIILLFALVNVWSVKGMGRLEDLMVYTKLAILVVISWVLIDHGEKSLPALFARQGEVELLSVFMVAAITFVAYEGFELVINAVDEMETPEKNIPRAVYIALALAVLIYVVIALGAILAIPFGEIIRNKEYALAAGAGEVMGRWGNDLVILGALLATSSAISGTMFGASRQMAAVARDGFMPRILSRRQRQIPVCAIAGLSVPAFVLVLSGSLQVILEFGSITFLVVSLLMAWANFRQRRRTQASAKITVLAMLVLSAGVALIVWHEYRSNPRQLGFILGLYLLLTVAAWLFSRLRPVQR